MLQLFGISEQPAAKCKSVDKGSFVKFICYGDGLLMALYVGAA